MMLVLLYQNTLNLHACLCSINLFLFSVDIYQFTFIINHLMAILVAITGIMRSTQRNIHAKNVFK